MKFKDIYEYKYGGFKVQINHDYLMKNGLHFYCSYFDTLNISCIFIL